MIDSASILTVTVPAVSRGLTDLASIQAEMGLIGATTDAAYLTGQILTATAAIQSYCGRSFARETVREVFRDVVAQRLTLARTPVASVTSVTVDGSALDAADYEADLDSGILYRLSSDTRLAWAASKVTLVYVAGYILPGQAGCNLPHDIQRACVLTVAANYSGRGRDPLIRSEAAQDVGQVSYLDPRVGMEGLPPQAAGLLNPYRVRRM